MLTRDLSIAICAFAIWIILDTIPFILFYFYPFILFFVSMFLCLASKPKKYFMFLNILHLITQSPQIYGFSAILFGSGIPQFMMVCFAFFWLYWLVYFFGAYASRRFKIKERIGTKIV